MGKRIASILASVALALALVPAGAFVPGATQAHAATVTVDSFTVTGGKNGTDYSYENGVLIIETGARLVIRNADPNTATTTDWSTPTGRRAAG